jgi:hypothetical protein
MPTDVSNGASCKIPKSEFLRRHIRPPGAIIYRERGIFGLAVSLMAYFS